MYLLQGDLSKEANYTKQGWEIALVAIRFNMRKELIDRYSPLMPYMKEKHSKEIVKQIDELSNL